MADKFPGKAVFTPGKKAWSVKCDIAMPCAFQNELAEDDAKELIANGVKYVAEVSNMGCQPGAIAAFQAAKIPFGPGKAVNAGGVATSGLEICQNAGHINWTAKEVDEKLKKIMKDFHDMASTDKGNAKLYADEIKRCVKYTTYLTMRLDEFMNATYRCMTIQRDEIHKVLKGLLEYNGD
jgi:glutamate dehydrogenase (NADP+)